jgi:carbon storage regulator
MLVISRRKGESITIGADIEVIVTQVTRSGVKLGIRAPRGYTVLRSEVRAQIRTANAEAARSSVEQAALLAQVASALPGGGTGSLLDLRRQVADGDPSQGGDGAPSPAPGAETSAPPTGRAPKGETR